MTERQLHILQPYTLLKALAETTRLRIVSLLLRNQELCVCHLQEMLSLSQPKISRHLHANTHSMRAILTMNCNGV